MRIQCKRLFKATVSAILVFVLVDTFVELIISRVTGITLLSYFEQMQHRHYGVQFHLLNIIFFSLEMLLVMTSYAVLRPLFKTRAAAIVACTLFFITFIGLFLLQLINLGVYPLKPALIFCVSTIVGFPSAVFVGAVVYERVFQDTVD